VTTGDIHTKLLKLKECSETYRQNVSDLQNRITEHKNGLLAFEQELCHTHDNFIKLINPGQEPIPVMQLVYNSMRLAAS
jgi:hypothetical protein